MPSIGGMPTLSQVCGWGTAHLTEAARQWTTTATVWEDAFTEVATQITHPGGVLWEGVAAESAQHGAYTDRLLVVGLADQLHDAARIARTGAMQIDEARRLALRTVESAESAGFTVGEDFSVTDPRLYDAGTAAVRQAQAEAFTTDLRAGVGALVATDSGVGGQLTAATAGLGSASFPESSDAAPAVQLVDYKKSPIPDPGTPDDPAPADRAPNEVYPGRDARGRFLPGNSGTADGAAAAELRLQEFEEETGATLIRQQIRAAVTDPITGNPITDPKTGKPLYRYYDALQPTSTPGQYIGIEVKSGNAGRTRTQTIFDGRVSPQTPATGTLNGELIKIVDTRLLNAPTYLPGEGVPRGAIEPLPEVVAPQLRGGMPLPLGVIPDDAMPHVTELPGHLAGAPEVPILGDGLPDYDH